MFVAVCRMALVIPGAGSLKTKRMVLRSVLDGARARFKLSIAEVGDQDLWQRASIGFAVVSNEGAHANAMADTVSRYIEGARDVIVADRALEILSFGSSLAQMHDAGKVER